MTRTLIVIAAFLTLSVPAALAVPPADKGKPEKPGKSQSAPGQSAEKNAAKACKGERGTTAQTMAAFKAKYGTNANKANAFGKCVSAKAKKAKEQEAEERFSLANTVQKYHALYCRLAGLRGRTPCSRDLYAFRKVVCVTSSASAWFPSTANAYR